MAYTNSLGQTRVFVRDGNKIGLGVPYVYVPPTILDETAFTPIVSYSLRKLKTTYPGSAIRVRRSYDNAESNIGFASNGILDTAALKSFVDEGLTLGNQDIANWDSISYTNQSIVTDSLIFHVNTANTSSYSGSGTTLNSLVGSFPGTMTGVSFEQSNGGTLGFDGSSSRISYDSTIFTSAPTNFSLSVWVYINDLPTSHREILSWWTSVNNGGSLFFGITSGGGIRFGEQTIYGLTDEHVGRWVEISIVKDGTLLSAYINGAILNSATANVSFNLQSNLTIGMHPGYGEYFSGRLAQVKIYNKALSNSEVYQNFRATSATFREDHDALSFITTSGLTQSLHKNAVHILVKDLKNNKLWDKLRVVYPFVGGNANSHKYNLKTPSSFALSFYGGWTHSSTGAYPNGTNGWANTNYNPSINSLSSSDLHLSYYSRTNNDNGGIEIGAQSSSSLSLYVQLKTSNYTYFGTNNTYNQPYGGNFIRLTSTTSAGNFIYLKTSSRQDPFYRDGQYVGQLNMANGAANDAIVNKEIYIGSYNNGTTASNFSNRETAFISIGQYLDDIEVYKYNYIIQKFQTVLGRQIGASYSTPNIHPDVDIDVFLQNSLVTDTTQTNALTKLVSSMKYEGIWNTTTALYPFIGATAHSHRFNLKSQKYTLSFSGGWTHTSTGGKPNGTNAFATTRLVPSSTFTLNNGHFGAYTRTDSDGGYDIFSSTSGSTNYMGISARSNYRLTPLLNNSHYSSIDPKESTGFSFGMRGAIGGTFSETTSMYLMKNDTIDYLDQNVDGFTNYTTLAANGIILAAWFNGTTQFGGYSSREQSFTTIGTKAMTQLQAQKYSRIVHRYQSDLSRSATITDLKYSNATGFVKTWYDQSGTGLNLIMNSKASQPLIYDNGSVIVDDNNRPAIQFDGWNDALIAQKNINFQNVGSIIAVNSGTASGISTMNNRTVIQSTTIGTFLPSAINWGAIPRLNNSRMVIRTHGDNSYDSVSSGDIGWSGTSGGYLSGLYGGYNNYGNTVIKDYGVNISSFFLIGSSPKLSNNFLIDNSISGYNSMYQGTSGLIVGANLIAGYSAFSKMKIQEILMFSKSYLISKKILLERNIYDYYLPFTTPASAVDTDVKNLAIANKLNNTTSSALNDLVTGLKTNGLWDKMVAIYPITGTLSHYGSSYNLKSISLDSSEWTLANSGISLGTSGISYGGGSGGASSIIYKALSDTFTSNNFHMSMYVSGGTLANYNGGVGKGIYAVGNNIITHLSLSPTVKQYNNISVTQSSTTGYFVASSLTQNKLFRNGSLIGTAALSATMSDCYKNTNINGSGGAPRIAIAADQGVAQWTNIQTGFITFGYGLTDAEVSTLSTLVLTYQTALGR
jgi:hypothetical protein